MREPPIKLRELRELPVVSQTSPRGGRRLLVELTPAERDALVEAVEAAKALNYGSFGAASRDRLADALARFEASS